MNKNRFQSRFEIHITLIEKFDLKAIFTHSKNGLLFIINIYIV